MSQQFRTPVGISAQLSFSTRFGTEFIVKNTEKMSSGKIPELSFGRFSRRFAGPGRPMMSACITSDLIGAAGQLTDGHGPVGWARAVLAGGDLGHKARAAGQLTDGHWPVGRARAGR